MESPDRLTEKQIKAVVRIFRIAAFFIVLNATLKPFKIVLAPDA
nr:MAG TPA: hypothetical protein [Caudoviricetes sp.]